VANRDRHRQGLVYGPVRQSGPRDRGRIVGNLLGLLVVVVTVSVLALAIYFVIQARGVATVPPAATATPVAATAEPSSSASPTQPAAPTQSSAPVASSTLPTTAPPPTVVATQAPLTPGPTLFVPQVMIGPGYITFGTIGDTQYRVVDPGTTFAVDQQMVWSAYLTRTANSDDLRVRILKMDATQPSGQLLVREEPVTPRSTNAQIFFRHVRALGATAGTGLFTVEYLLGDEVLALGSFLIQ
jgi:hypothetical protein